MKKLMLCIALVAGLQCNTSAQFIEGLDRKVKSKVKTRIDNHVDQLIDKGLDETEKSIKNDIAARDDTARKPADQHTEIAKTSQNKNTAQSQLMAYSKFDFVPGDVILYHEDFANEAIGEMPANWNANGNGQIVILDGYAGKWLRMFPGTKYLTGNEKGFGLDYTIEFDVLLDGTPPSGTRFLPDMAIGLFSSADKPATDNVFLLPHAKPDNLTEIYFNPNVDALSRVKLESKKSSGVTTFKIEPLELATFGKTIGRSTHYAMQVQKQRLRFWVDGIKIFDIPRAINLLPAMNQLYFNVKEYWPYNESNYGMYVSNIKIATGLPDMRHKLSEVGKFSTTGILFDVNSDQIKPQSYGTLQSIAQVVKDSDLRIKIIGHTDSDGEAASNLQLSRKRAEAVKSVLMREFQIDGSKLETGGKGESEPVAGNSIKESKALNRRVEFIKI